MTRTLGLLATLAACMLALSACDRADNPSPPEAGLITSDAEPARAAAVNPSPRPVAPMITEAAARQRAAMVDDVAYILDLTLPLEATDFHGAVEIRFDFTPGDVPLTVDFSGGQVSALSVNGQSAVVDYNGYYLTLPTQALVAGENTLSIHFSHPYARDGSGLHRFDDAEDGTSYVYTDFEPYNSNELFPQFDQPDLKATYELAVTVPADWQVISATRERRIEDLGETRVWRFPETPRFSTYLISLHAGPYAVFEDTDFRYPLRVFARQSVAHLVKPEQWFNYTRKGFNFFDAYYEVPYPFEKYDQVIVPDFNAGAMENVAAVTFTERLLRRAERTRNDKRRLAGIILHEMAHMWFGDLVTMRWWNDLWLNEAFATYMATIAAAEATEFDDTWQYFFAFTKQAGYVADARVTTHAIDGPVGDTDSAFARFDAITYRKGASVLHQLANYLGPEQFRLGVSRYLKQHAWGNTELKDFMGALAEQSGLDLTDWTVDWLQRSGTNTLRADFACEDGRISRFDLVQGAPADHPVLRTHRLQVGLYKNVEGTGVTETGVYPVKVSGERTSVDEAVGQPCPELVYPNHGDWAFVRVRLDGDSLEYSKRHLDQVDDPMLRGMLWQTLWEMTWDAELGMDEYLSLTRANLPGETDLVVLRQVLQNLKRAVDTLLRGGDTGAALLAAQGPAVEEMLLTQLAAAPAGSDLKRRWFDSLVEIAHGVDTLALLRTVLAGERSIDGMELDQDRRWKVLLRLSQFDVEGASELITIEAADDPSDQGYKQALAARASLPGVENKSAWLERVQAAEDKLSELRFVMRNLLHPNQAEVAATLIDALMQPVLAFDGTRDPEYVESYVEYLAPNLCSVAGADRLRGTRDRNPDLPAPAVKELLERIEDNERCAMIMARLDVPDDGAGG